MDKQAPLTDNAEPSTPRWARKPFVSGHGRAVVAIGFLALSIVVSLLTITIVHDYFFIGVSPITIGGSLLSAAVGAGCVVSFLLWFRRVYRNLPAIGAEGLAHSPGSAVAWWFVPLAQFWKPLKVATEIWHASDRTAVRNDDLARHARPMPALLAVWWMAWLSALVLGTFIAGPDRVHYQGYVVTTGILIATVYDILAAALAMAVILEIDRRQSSQQSKGG